MTVKSAVSFIDEHHAFARSKVDRGEFASVSAVVAAGIEKLRDEEAEREVMVDAMAEEIRRRAETPDEEFVEHAPGSVPAAQSGPAHRFSNSHTSPNPIRSCISPIEMLPASRSMDDPLDFRCP